MKRAIITIVIGIALIVGIAADHVYLSRQIEDIRTAPVIIDIEGDVTARRSVLADTSGNIIREFDTQNFDVAGGTAEVSVDTLEETLTVEYSNPARNIQFRNYSGVVQYKNAGETWLNIGGASGSSGGESSGIGSSGVYVYYTWTISGPLAATGEFDLPRFPGVKSQLVALSAYLDDTGDSGNDLVIDILNDGSSMIGTATKPSVSAGSSTESSLVLSFDDPLITASDLLTAEIETYPTGSENLVVEALIRVYQTQALTAYTWTVSGNLTTGTVLDLFRFPGLTSTIQYATAVLEDTGTGGSNLVVDINNESGTSFVGAGGTKLSITANSGSRQSDSTSDFDTTAISSTNLVSMEIESVPTGAEDLSVTLLVEHEEQRTYSKAVWKVSGSVTTGTLDLPRKTYIPGNIVNVSAVLEDTGTGGSNLVVDLLRDGTSLYAAGGTKPTITANSGTNQTDTSTDLVDTIVLEPSVLQMEVESAPTASADLVVEILFETTPVWDLSVSNGTTTSSNTVAIVFDDDEVSITESDGTATLDIFVVELSKYTADPCGTLTEGTIFYNDTDDHLCLCDGAGVDSTVDGTDDCFGGGP